VVKVATIHVEVSATPGSTDPGQAGAVQFKYKDAEIDPKNEVLEDGSGTINLRRFSSRFEIRFVLKTRSVEWDSQRWKAELPDDARDAIWIYEDGEECGAQSKQTQFADIKVSKKAGLDDTVSVIAFNKRFFLYKYAIGVKFTKADASHIVHHDPQIKNGGLTNVGSLTVVQKILTGLLAATWALMAANLIWQFAHS